MQLVVLQITIVGYARIRPFDQKLPIHRFVLKNALVSRFTFSKLALVPLIIFKRPCKISFNFSFRISDSALSHLSEFKDTMEPSLFPGEDKNPLTVTHSLSIDMPIVTCTIFVVDHLLVCRLGGNFGPATHSHRFFSLGLLDFESLLTGLQVKRSAFHDNSRIASHVICKCGLSTVKLLDFDWDESFVGLGSLQLRFHIFLCFELCPLEIIF